MSDSLDREWLEMGLSMDATYIARLVMQGKQAEAAAYIEKTSYLDRMLEWRLGK